ncbi:hypothetical protein CSC2_21670 [Clostridium zeae]|uniref:Uncharacterized protein n=1 Tax=Clostridium zeae TaxID=2759022 RepID=A0ABQ1EAE5_9CLOT|nr:hypothetical protein CSC2_21670 [Clostridium zeae]
MTQSKINYDKYSHMAFFRRLRKFLKIEIVLGKNIDGAVMQIPIVENQSIRKEGIEL